MGFRQPFERLVEKLSGWKDCEMSEITTHWRVMLISAWLGKTDWEDGFHPKTRPMGCVHRGAVMMHIFGQRLTSLDSQAEGCLHVSCGVGWENWLCFNEC